MSVPFIGRREELGTLKALIARGRRAGAPAVALVIGDPGTGKSRLVRELVADADARRAVIVSGFEPTQAIPLAAVSELVRRLAAVPEHGARLERLVFGTSELAAQGVLLQAFETAHRALTAFGPLVLVIDDLQWVDGQSVGLVHYLIGAAETIGNPLVVIAAARPSPAAAEFSARVLERVSTDRATSLQLGGLAVDDAVHLVRAIDPEIDRREGENLWRRSAGSPFWLEALARAHGAGRRVDLIDERLRSLSAEAAALVSALAVAARPLDVSDAAPVLEWPVERVEDAFRELEARGLAAGHLGAMRLTHDLIREAVARDIPDGMRRRLHGAVAHVIEATAGDDLQLLAEALDHRVAAGRPAVDIAMRVVGSPRRRLIGPEAMERLSAVAESLAPGAADRVALQEALARLAGEVGLHESAVRHWGEVAAATREPAQRQRAEIEAARAAYLLGRADEVRSHLVRARGLPVDAMTALTLDALEADLAMWLDHDTAAGAVAADRALVRGRALIEAAGGTAALSHEARVAVLAALDAAADAALQQDRGDEVIRLSEEATAIAEPLGEETRIAVGLRGAFELRAVGLTQRAIHRYREAWDTARRLLLPTSMVEAGHGLARALRDVGRLHEARAVALESVDLQSRLGSLSPRWGTASPILHSIELSLGEPGALARLREDAVIGRDPHFGIGLHQMIAAHLARREGRERADEVEQELAAARAAWSAARCPRCGRELAIVSAELLARIGRPEDARRELAAWEAGLVGPDYVMRQLWHARARAAIALAEGGPHATGALAELAAAFERFDLVEDAIWAYLDLGTALARSGDRARAVEAYGRAAAMADGISAVDLGRLAKRGLRELGVRAWRRGGTGPAAQRLHALSEREQEVSRLVAAGASNREIADALVVSPKTIERHMTNILAKVGARNRTELARLVDAGAGAGADRVRVSPDD